MRNTWLRRGLRGVFWLLGAVVMPTHAVQQETPTRHEIVVLKVDGIINPASADFIIAGLATAARDKAQLAVIELDTPGGLDSSMRAIVKRILASPVPVATYVSPAGARAASAGTFILYASHIAAMTPASNLGAASPVSIGLGGNKGKPPVTSPASPSADNTTSTSPKPDTTDTMTRKVTNDATAYIRSLAQLRGRNVEFAEKAVRNAASLSAPEALKAGVIDMVADNLNQLLAKVDGRQVKLGTGQTVRVATSLPTIVQISPDWRTQVLGFLANPQVALILLMAGVAGLFYELMNPGLAVPGIAGLICLLMGLYAFQMLPVNWAGVGLVALGTALMIAEAFVPAFGAAGVGGVVAFVLGGLFLTDTDIPGYGLSVPFLIGMAVACAILLFLIGTMAIRAQRHRVVTGAQEMIGLHGVVTSVNGTVAYAQVRGESWKVEGPAAFMPGDAVRVVSLRGLTLLVEPVQQTSAMLT